MKKAMHDAEAIRRCRGGEVEAFRHLVHRYQRRALAHARALTGNDADAADAAQSAFLDAFRHMRPSQMPLAAGHSIGNSNDVKAEVLFTFLKDHVLLLH